jgi:hypothetical protein
MHSDIDLLVIVRRTASEAEVWRRSPPTASMSGRLTVTPATLPLEASAEPGGGAARSCPNLRHRPGRA